MREKEDIKIAQTAGFCWGVKRAMDMTLATANETDGPIQTNGPLIHNPQVIEMLEGKEVYAVNDSSELKENAVVVIRTHGITPAVRNELKRKHLQISDATCPLVAKVQGIIKKYANKGFHTIIIGDKGHAEVTGLLGYALGRGYVINSVEAALELPVMENVNVVAQTTCDITKYDGIVDAVISRYPDAIITNTICEATEERQSEVVELASEVDALVVVGGKNSANTRRLADIASQAGAKTFLIETQSELDAVQIGRYNKIGVTAGASTPTWMIERVHQRLREIREARPTRLRRAVRRVVGALVVSNIYTAIGAGMMVYANCILAGLSFSYVSAFIAMFYLFSMHTLNRLTDVQTFKHNEPEKIEFYIKHKAFMTTAAGLSAIITLGLAFQVNLNVAFIIVASLAMGLAYTVKWFPKSKVLRIHRLKDIPASKDLFVGFAWAVVTALAPAMAVEADILSAPVAVAFILTLSLVYVRSVLSDIRDIHGDRLVGRETIPILIGKNATKLFLVIFTSGLAMVLLGVVSAGWVGSAGYIYLLSILYTGAYLKLYDSRKISRGLRFDIAVDGVFYFIGLLAFIWAQSGL